MLTANSDYWQLQPLQKKLGCKVANLSTVTSRNLALFGADHVGDPIPMRLRTQHTFFDYIAVQHTVGGDTIYN